MLTEVKKHIRLIALYFRYNLSAAMEYRAGFITQTAGMLLNDAFFVFFWLVVFDKVKSIGGYGFKEVMLIWALSASSYGILHIVFGNIRRLSGIIINGELDTYLLQPKNVYINVHCSRMVVSAWGDLVYGYILFLVIYGFNPFKLLLYTLFVLLGGALAGALMSSADTLTFFIGNSSGITRMVTEFLLNFSLYPESIFRREVKWLMYSLIPTGFIIFIPCRLLKAFSWYGLAGLLVIDILYIAAAYNFFRLGLKRYESGNLMTTKL